MIHIYIYMVDIPLFPTKYQYVSGCRMMALLRSPGVRLEPYTRTPTTVNHKPAGLAPQTQPSQHEAFIPEPLRTLKPNPEYVELVTIAGLLSCQRNKEE